MPNTPLHHRMFHRVHPNRAPAAQHALMERAQQLATAGDLEGMENMLRDIEEVGRDADRARVYIEEHGEFENDDRAPRAKIESV